MKAMVIDRIPSLSKPDAPLTAVELPVSEPEALEIRIRVRACGVCHAELDEIEGRTAPPRLPVVPGHEVVGRVDKLGAGSGRFEIGERVGGVPPHRCRDPAEPTGKDLPPGGGEPRPP